jgi:hypothetical protein
VLLARRLGEVGALGEAGVPPTSVAKAEEAVDNFFCDGPSPRRMKTMQALFSVAEEQDQVLSVVV